MKIELTKAQLATTKEALTEFVVQEITDLCDPDLPCDMEREGAIKKYTHAMNIALILEQAFGVKSAVKKHVLSQLDFSVMLESFSE